MKKIITAALCLALTSAYADQKMQCPKELQCNGGIHCTYPGGDMDDWSYVTNLTYPGKYNLSEVVVKRQSDLKEVECHYVSLVLNTNGEIYFTKFGDFAWPGMPIDKNKWRVGVTYICNPVNHDCDYIDQDKQ